MRSRLFVDLCQRFGSCCDSEKYKERCRDARQGFALALFSYSGAGSPTQPSGANDAKAYATEAYLLR